MEKLSFDVICFSFFFRIFFLSSLVTCSMTFLFAQSLASLFIFPSICNISKAVTIPNGHTIPHCYEVFVTHIIDVFSLSLFQVNLITSLSSLVLGVFAVTFIIHNVAFLFLPIIQLYFTLPHWNPQNWNVFFGFGESNTDSSTISNGWMWKTKILKIPWSQIIDLLVWFCMSNTFFSKRSILSYFKA